ncbi:MAG: hypothetical protein AAF739_00200 [Pseudomonadota bacterium]
MTPNADIVRRREAVFLCLKTGAWTGIALVALGLFFAWPPSVANAMSALTCGPQFSTVADVRAGIPDTAPAMISLNPLETDRYLDQLGHGRPSNSEGRSAIIVVVPNRGALLGMIDGPNMCSPFLRVTQTDHRDAIDAVRGTTI